MIQDEIMHHWRRSQQALSSSEILLKHDSHFDSVSRSYYAILHAARAALLIHNVVPKSHNHLRQAFGLYLVQNGDIEKKWANILHIAYRNRVVADYIADHDIPFESAQTLFEQAKKFVTRMKEFLEANNIELP